MFFFNHFLHGYALMNSFYITCNTGGITKKTANLNLSFKKADQHPSPSPSPQERESNRKKVGVSVPILRNCIHEYG
jgi:hypothetical protein